MIPKNPKRIVIDASVSYSASDLKPDADLVVRLCCETLETIQKYNYQLVFTEEIIYEWNKHSTKFSRRWLRNMLERKRVVKISISEDKSISQKVNLVVTDIGVRKLILKDCHLVDAALAADRIVLSRDEQVKYHLCRYAEVILEIQQICWMNPADPDEKVVAWIKSGAKHSDCRKLVPHDAGRKPRRRKPKDR
jgi:hypothetical protein